MIARLIKFALRQRLLLLIATLGLIGAGVQAFLSLPIDAFPDVSTTQVKIVLKAPGMTPEEVETRVIAPIEIEMLGIPKKRLLRSSAKYGIADITLDFDDGTDIYWARQQVSERLGGVMPELPPDVSGGMAPITTPLGEVLMFTIDGDLSLEEKRTLLDWTIRPQLRTLPGVADVNSLGGFVRTYEIAPDLLALKARGLKPEDLEHAIAENNRNEGGGRIQSGEEGSLVRIEGSVGSLDDLRSIVVGKVAATPVRLGDVADVRIGSMTRYGAVTQDGQGEAVEGLVLALRGANARQLVADVRHRLDEIAPTLPPGVHTRVFYDRGELVSRAVGTVSRALAEAIVLVVVLLLAFLGNLRAAVVVACVLPLAALLTFIAMRLWGLSANLMSLGGLAIAIGMLVDAAVVVVENIESHLARPQEKDNPLLHRIFIATREVSVPVVAGIAIIVVVFLPLLSLQGLEGKLFAPVALTIVFSLSGSLLLSLTVIPALASVLIRPGDADHEPWLVRHSIRLYRPLLQRVLRNERRAYIGAGAAAMLALVVFLMTGKTFMPTLDEGDILVQVNKLPSISLAQSIATDVAIQQALLAEVPEIRRIVARVGTDELGLDPMGPNDTDTFLVLKPPSEWRRNDKAWLAEQIRATLSRFPGMDTSFTQPIEMRVAEMLTGTRGDLAVKLYGTDLATLNNLGERIAAVLKTLPGAQDVLMLKNEGQEYTSVTPNRLAIGRLGLSVQDVGNLLRRQIEGEKLGIVIEDGRRTPVMIRGNESARSSPQRLADQQIVLPNGESVPLTSIADVRQIDGPVKVDHEDAQRLVVIQSNVTGRDLVGFVEEAKQKIAAQIQLPAGYRLAWGGQFENQQRAAKRLLLAIPVALLIILQILYSTLGSIRQAVLVIANIPFALIGGVLALGISGEYLSVPASVGFIALLGIAVLNGLVLISHYNHLSDKGLPLDRIVTEGTERRLRPVLMTASITAFGLIPLLFASGPGSEIQKPLAIVVVGGLVSSTALTLFLLPLLYRRFANAGERA